MRGRRWIALLVSVLAPIGGAFGPSPNEGGSGSLAAQFGSGSPDLVVEELTADPAEPEPDETVELVAVIANRGRGPVYEPFSVVFEVNGELIATVPITSRPRRNARVEVRTRWVAVEGVHRVTVRADAFQDVAETDEQNNRAEIDLVVQRRQGARSLTLELYRAVAAGLGRAGEALQVPPNEDLLQLFEDLRSASRSAQEAFEGGADRLERVPLQLPTRLQGEEQLRMGEEIASLYRAFAASFAQANEGLERLNLQLLTSAFERIRADLGTLATYALEGISLRGLEPSLELMDQALERARELQQAAEGGGEGGEGNSEEIDTSAVVEELLDVLARIGQAWEIVAEDFVQSGSAQQAQFLTREGTPLERLRPRETLVISAPHAVRMTLEIFDEAGRRLFQARTEANSLLWQGTDSVGAPLPPGRYFYRLEVLDRSGHTRVELGQIFLSE